MVDKILLCPYCNKDIYKSGMIEVIEDSITETEYWFGTFSHQKSSYEIGNPKIYTRCRACRGKIDIHPNDLILYYESKDPVYLIEELHKLS